MLVWLLVLLLLIGLIYVVYRNYLNCDSVEDKKEVEHHYTFKI